jgi:formylmethanofuran dehydrogenase subunit E
MSVFRSDDPVRDFDRRDREQQDWEDSLPRCERCGEILDTYLYEIDDEILCEGCMERKYRRNVEDYLDETECD